MPNTSRVMGVRPINKPYYAQPTMYQAATGTALYMYHPVDLDANGRVILATPGSNNYIVGVIVGLLDDTSGPIDSAYSGYVPANPVKVNSAGVVNVLVADNPHQYFLIEEDTGGAALDAQSIGAGASWTYLATTGNTVSGVANVVLDRSTLVATGSGQQFRLVKKWDKPDNDYGNFCKWIVVPYYHRYNPPITEAAASTLI